MIRFLETLAPSRPSRMGFNKVYFFSYPENVIEL